MDKSVPFELSDDEILDMGMFYGDPCSEFELLDLKTIPENPEWGRFVTKYKCKDRIKCMRPTCRTPHNEGAIVAIRDGEQEIGLINIGHCCGAKYFPDEYRFGSTSYDHDLRRKNLIKRKRDILSREQQIMAWFDQQAPIFEHFDKRHGELDSFLPDLLNLLRSEMGSNGELRIRSKSGKTFKEALKAQGVKVGRSADSWEVVHVVSGPAFFRFKGELSRRALHAREELSQLLDQLRPDGLAVDDMREKTNRIAEIGERITAMVEQCQTLPDALSPSNLKGIARWLRRSSYVNQAVEWSYRGGGLHRSSGAGLPQYFLKSESSTDTQDAQSFPLVYAA